MHELLSQETLENRLFLLKATLDSIDFSALDNIIFLNVRSFYSFVSNFKCPKDSHYTINELLDELENYIPVSFSSLALNIFLKTTSAGTDEEINKMLDAFSLQLRFDFINALRFIEGQEDWDYVVKMCENLRAQKKEKYIFL